MTTPLTRRHFMQLTGILALSASVLPEIEPLRALQPKPREYARLLKSVVSPGGHARLSQDAVVVVSEQGFEEHNWLRTSDIQTMPGFSPDNPFFLPDAFPALMQVITPSALIYSRCDVASDRLDRLGYGSGAWVVDVLGSPREGDPDWLAIADEKGLIIGWSQASAWSPATTTALPHRIDHLLIDTHAQTLALFEQDTQVARWSISAPLITAPMNTTISSRLLRDEGKLAWSLRLANGLSIGGADWHNDFGNPNARQQIELHPYTARWLYQHLADDTTIDIS
jgi:hypothetical protein